MNESDKKQLRNSYRDIRWEFSKVFYPIDVTNICASMCEKIIHINNFINNASDLFEKSLVGECSDYKRFYSRLGVLLQDLRKHIDDIERDVPVDSVVKKGIEKILAVFYRDMALFGYSEEEAHEGADEEAKRVPGSYFTQYDFTLPVSLKPE